MTKNMEQNDNKTSTEINYYLQAFEDELPDIDVLLDRLSIFYDSLTFEDELPDLDEMFSNSEQNCKNKMIAKR